MSIQSIERRLAEMKQRMDEMDAHIQAIADKEATLESVVKAVVLSFQDMQAKLVAASTAKDWTEVDALSVPLDRAIAALEALVQPAPAPAVVDAPPADLPPAE